MTVSFVTASKIILFVAWVGLKLQHNFKVRKDLNGGIADDHGDLPSQKEKWKMTREPSETDLLRELRLAFADFLLDRKFSKETLSVV